MNKRKYDKHTLKRPSSEIDYLINEYVLNERYRSICRLKLIDGLTFENVAEIEDMSVSQTKRIVYSFIADVHIYHSKG